MLLLLGSVLIWVQVRMFRDIDVDRLQLEKFDGFNRLQPRYEV